MNTRMFLPAVWVACAWAMTPGAAASDSYRNPQLLMDAEELSGVLTQPEIRLLDARPAEEYRQGHLPGAFNLPAPSTDDLEANRQGYPLFPERARQFFRAAGISDSSRVVVYDDQGNRFAARVFYVLEFFGHSHVQVLNGGIGKWKSEGRPLTTEVPSVTPGDFRPSPNPSLIATSEWIQAHLKDPEVQWIDARTPAEFAGEDVRGPRGGHIPGAVNLEWTRVIAAGDIKTFLPASQLAEVFASAQINSSRQVVTYCQVGIRGAALYFALRLLGFERVRVYDGSWQEWSADPNLPVEK